MVLAVFLLGVNAFAVYIIITLNITYEIRPMSTASLDGAKKQENGPSGVILKDAEIGAPR